MKPNKILYAIQATTPLPLPTTAQLDNQPIEIKPIASINEFVCLYSPLKSGCLLLSIDTALPGSGKAKLLNTLTTFMARANAIPCLVCLTDDDNALAFELLKAGAFDVIVAPTEATMAERLLAALTKDESRLTARIEQQRVLAAASQLSAKERTVMRAITDGKTQRMIASSCRIEPTMVEVYRMKIMYKMQAESLATLVNMRALIENSGETLFFTSTRQAS